MFTIERATIGSAHEEIIKNIVLDGVQVMTKHGITLEYPESVCIKITQPFKEPVKCPANKFPLEGMKIYAEQLLTVAPVQFDYNCGNRWFDYFGDGDGTGINQIQHMVIEELQKDKSSRRAVATSIQPLSDYVLTHIPCISFLQFMIRNNKLNLTVYIRSNDMLSAWGADAYALSNLLKYVGEQLKIETSYLEIISVSAHIYFKRDAEELMRFRKLINW